MKDIKTKPIKTRRHYILFCEDTPFKPKRENVKTKYRRVEKHKNKLKDNIEPD